MISSKILLDCIRHAKQVIMIDVSPQASGSSRTLCVECIQEITQEISKHQQKVKLDWLQVNEFFTKVDEHYNAKKAQMQEKFEEKKKELNQIQKSLITLRDEAIEQFNKMVQSITNILQNLSISIEQEFQNVKLCNNMPNKKVNEMAEILAKEKITNFIDSSFQEELESQLINLQKDLLENTYKKFPLIFNKNSQFTEKQDLNQKVGTKIQSNPGSENTPVQTYQSSSIFLNQGMIHSIQDQENTEEVKIEKQLQLITQSTLCCSSECQILVSNQKQKLIAGAIMCDIMIWKQNKVELSLQGICKAHTEQVTGLAVHDSKRLIISGGQDKLLNIWGETKNDGWRLLSSQEQSDQITNLILTANSQELIVSYQNFSLKFFRINSEFKLNFTQKIVFQSQIQSLSINKEEECLAIACKDKFIEIYTIQKAYWQPQLKLKSEGVIQQLHFTEDFEIVCQQSMPDLLVIFYIFNENIEVFQTINLNAIGFKSFIGHIFESFPIFMIDQTLCCQFGKLIYLVEKKESGQYKVVKQILGNYEAACSDITGTRIILKDRFQKQIQVCSLT